MTHITFDSGLAGILRMGLDGQVYEFQEVLSLGDLSHCADPRSRAQARQIIWRGYGDGKAAERRQMEINARLLSRAGELAARSEEITFWTSGSAADTCSLLFLLTRFPWGKAPLRAARFDRRDMAGLPDRVKDFCAQRQEIGRGGAPGGPGGLRIWRRLHRLEVRDSPGKAEGVPACWPPKAERQAGIAIEQESSFGGNCLHRHILRLFLWTIGKNSHYRIRADYGIAKR